MRVTYSCLVVERRKRKNINTRSKDRNVLAKVGELGHLVSAVDGANSARSLGGSGREVLSILELVSSSDSHEETGVGDTLDSQLDGAPVAVGCTERHVDDSAFGAGSAGGGAFLGVLDGEEHGGHDVGHHAETVLVADLDADDLGLLGNTECLCADGTGDVSTMTEEIVSGVVNLVKVGKQHGAVFELRVVEHDTGVDDIAAGVSAS